MTGAKLVTGTLNGGGPEILINTRNGDRERSGNLK